MHTAQHLIANCLQGELATGRTIILVTHHISDCLPAADLLVELSSGIVQRRVEKSDFGELELPHTPPNGEDETTSDETLTPHTPPNEADTKTPPSSTKQVHGKLIEAESRAEGRVSWRTYATYIRAAGIFSWILTIGLMLLIRLINIGNQVNLPLSYHNPPLTHSNRYFSPNGAKHIN